LYPFIQLAAANSCETIFINDFLDFINKQRYNIFVEMFE